MRLKPNDSPEMELNEKRNFEFRLAAAVGSNSISGTPEVTCPNLTVGTVSASGTTVTVPITAANTGTHMVKLSADLSSQETLVGVVRVKVIDSTREQSSHTDYD